MKIVCDKCATKYSIADEKVRNKVFKIRCKKCSHIIVVKGGDGAADGEPMTDNEDGATVAGGYDAAPAPNGAANGAGGDRVWFLVVSGEQVGPFNGSEVRARFGAGEIDGETYAWREGFGDWLRLATIDEFADIGGNGANGGETRRTDLSDMFAARAQPHDEDAGEDIFARQAPTAVASNPAADLFGGHAGGNEVTEAPRARAAAAAAPVAAAASAEPDHRLTGQRNENSVLFSLSNLQALATAGAAKASAPSASPVPSPAAAPAPSAARPGYATAKNEGSGLIDIRAMAAATLSSVGTTSSGHDAASDIPSFSAAPVFTPVVAAPVMLPTQPQGTPKWVWAVVSVGGAAFLGAAGLVVALLVRTPKVETPPAGNPPVLAMAQPASPNAAPAVAAPAAAAPAPVAAAPAVAAPAAAAPAAAAPTEAKAEGKAAKRDPSKGGGASKKGGDKPAAAPAVAAAAPAPAARPAPPPEDKPAPAKKKPGGGGGGDDLDDLLNSATGSKKSAAAAAPRPAAEPAADPNLPEQLDRGDVLAGMKAVQPKALACYQQYHVPGIAMVSVVIGKSGKVTSANVGGALAGTPTGDCVAKAVKTASFKQFKGAPMSIQYPFQLR